MSDSNINRWDYDRDEFYYDEENDELVSYRDGTKYTGDGEKIESY